MPAEELARRLPVPFTLTDVHAEFPDAFSEARARVAECPLEEFGGVVNHGAANLALLYSLACALDARTVAETGVAFGWSTLALLLATRGSGGHVFSVDLPHCFGAPDGRWRDGDEWVGAAVPHALRERWTLFVMADREGLPRMLRTASPIDLAHYHSDQSPDGCAFGHAALWDSLREGGALIADDVDCNLAFRRLTERLGREPLIVEGDGKYQGILFR